MCVDDKRNTNYNKDVFTDNPWGGTRQGWGLQIFDSIILQRHSNVRHRCRCMSYY